MFEIPAISRRKIALQIITGLHVRFWSCSSSAIKIASSCRDKNRLCKRPSLSVQKPIILFRALIIYDANLELPNDISVHVSPQTRQLLSFNFASIWKRRLFKRIRVSVNFLIIRKLTLTLITYWFSIHSFLTVCWLVFNTVHARLVQLGNGFNHCMSCEAIKYFHSHKILTNGLRISCTFALVAEIGFSNCLPLHVTLHVLC